MHRTVLENATILDGTARPAFPGHLVIEGDRIIAVLGPGDTLPPADTLLDVSGGAVAPGFIDMHSHADWILPLDHHPDHLGCFVEQGVTTLVGGNCGISPAPIGPGGGSRMEGLASIATVAPLDYSWGTFAEFLGHLEETGPLVNIAELAGHASLRYAAATTRRGPMTPEELGRSLDMARACLDQGAAGLSFGLGYDPGMYSPLEELEAFCRVAAERNKPAAIHLKAYSWLSPCYPLTTRRSHNLLALEEMLTVGRRTGVKLQLSHFIFVGRNTWHTAPACLRRVENARQEGVDVMIDAFPFTGGNTTIHAPLPYWFLARIPGAFQSRWARLRLRAELALGFRLVGFLYGDFQVMNAAVAGWEDLDGLTIEGIARRWNTSSFDAMLRLAEASHGATRMLFHTYSGEPGRETVIESVLRCPFCLFETDAVIKDKGYPNPAGLGTFPKILGDFVRTRKLFALEEAVRRMTGASAERFGLKDRGRLLPGMAADVVVFDPQTIADSPPSGDKPAGKPQGILHVFVNGEHAVEDGKCRPGVRAGKVLRT